MLGCTPGQTLVLQAKGWPAGEARVELQLTAAAEAGRSGCRIRMREDVTHGPGRLVPQPVRQLAIAPRNQESLQRLVLVQRPRP